jgi:Protein of unknown function (DUF1168)
VRNAKQMQPIMSSDPTTSTVVPVNRHALTAVEKQRSQLDKLLKDPTKPAYVPSPPKEKTIRAAREMMKNVQGSSAGAGSGEFHVYKASRRREYERLKLLEEATQKVYFCLIFFFFLHTTLTLYSRKLKRPSLREDDVKRQKLPMLKQQKIEPRDKRRKKELR